MLARSLAWLLGDIFLILLLVLPYSVYLKKLTKNTALNYCLIVFAGMLAGFIISGWLLIELGHYKFYIESLNYLLFSTKEVSHGPYYDLITPIIKGYFVIAMDGMIILLLIALHYWLVSVCDRFSRYMWFVLLLLGLSVFYSYYNFIGVAIAGRLLSFLSLLSLLVLFWSQVKSVTLIPDIKTLALVILCLFVVLPVCSGAGFVNHIYLIPLSLPLVFMFFESRENIVLSEIKVKRLSQYLHSILKFAENVIKNKKILITSFSLAAVNGFAFVYGQDINRVVLTNNINHNKLSAIYLSQKESEELYSVLKVINKSVKKGEYLYVAWAAPMLNYLTDTKPYFYHPWLEIYTKKQIKKVFEERKNEGVLPVVVKYKNSRYDALLESFIVDNHYFRIYSEGDFTIYKVKQ